MCKALHTTTTGTTSFVPYIILHHTLYINISVLMITKVCLMIGVSLKLRVTEKVMSYWLVQSLHVLRSANASSTLPKA